MLSGTNLRYTKRDTSRIAHEAIRHLGPLTRADIARRTALTGQAISNLVEKLLDVDPIHEVEPQPEGRGAPATTPAIDPEGPLPALQVLLDRDRTRAAVGLSMPRA